MRPRQNGSWVLLTTLWLLFVVGVKIIEHLRAFGHLKPSFRYDLFVLLPLLLAFTLYQFYAYGKDIDDLEK